MINNFTIRKKKLGIFIPSRMHSLCMSTHTKKVNSLHKVHADFFANGHSLTNRKIRQQKPFVDEVHLAGFKSGNPLKIQTGYASYLSSSTSI